MRGEEEGRASGVEESSRRGGQFTKDISRTQLCQSGRERRGTFRGRCWPRLSTSSSQLQQRAVSRFLPRVESRSRGFTGTRPRAVFARSSRAYAGSRASDRSLARRSRSDPLLGRRDVHGELHRGDGDAQVDVPRARHRDRARRPRQARRVHGGRGGGAAGDQPREAGHGRRRPRRSRRRVRRRRRRHRRVGRSRRPIRRKRRRLRRLGRTSAVASDGWVRARLLQVRAPSDANERATRATRARRDPRDRDETFAPPAPRSARSRAPPRARPRTPRHRGFPREDAGPSARPGVFARPVVVRRAREQIFLVFPTA